MARRRAPREVRHLAPEAAGLTAELEALARLREEGLYLRARDRARAAGDRLPAPLCGPPRRDTRRCHACHALDAAALGVTAREFRARLALPGALA